MAQDDVTADTLADSVDDAMLAKTRPPVGAIALLGIAAGAQIGFGAIGYLVAQAGMTPGGATQLLSGIAFSVGLMLVGRRGADRALLAVGAAIESLLQRREPA